MYGKEENKVKKAENKKKKKKLKCATIISIGRLFLPFLLSLLCYNPKHTAFIYPATIAFGIPIDLIYTTLAL